MTGAGPAVVELFVASRARDLERWRSGEVQGSVIKDNGARMIWRVPAGRPALYVKRFPAELFRDRAAKEAKLLKALAAAGIPCPRAVALLRDRAGSYVVTEEIADADLLQRLIERGGPRRRELVAAFARLTRRLHDAGFDHQDFHAGNVLVRDGGLFVLDVHRARVGRLSKSRRVDGAAFAAMSFAEFTPLTEVFRFFREYGIAEPAARAAAFQRMRRLRYRHYRSRDARPLKEGSGFERRRGFMLRRGTDLEEVLEAAASPERVLVKRKPGGESIEHSGDFFIKRTTPARAKRIWTNSHSLIVRGIGTPLLQVRGDGWVAGEWIDGPDLYADIRTRFGQMGRAARDAALQRLARMVRRMHDRGIFHADLKAGNILVAGERTYVIDLDRVKLPFEVADRDRRFNLAQLNASVTPPLTKSDRLRFFRFYAGRRVSAWRDRKQWVREIMKITVARRHHWPPR